MGKAGRVREEIGQSRSPGVRKSEKNNLPPEAGRAILVRFAADTPRSNRTTALPLCELRVPAAFDEALLLFPDAAGDDLPGKMPEQSAGASTCQAGWLARPPT